MTSLGVTVTSCKGISWLPTWSWVPVAWRMSVVPSEVMTVSVVGGDVTGMPFLFWWVFICLARWSLRMNLLEHSMHTNFFSPGKRTGTPAQAQSHHITETAEFLFDSCGGWGFSLIPDHTSRGRSPRNNRVEELVTSYNSKLKPEVR